MKNGIKLSLLLALSAGMMGSCDSGNEDAELTLKTIKVGLITLHDESSTYDKNFIDAMYDALEELGMSESQLSLSTGVKEGNECYQEATALAATCDVIFADSFGHEDYMIQAARENPNVNFCHATGTKAHTTTDITNYTNAFASIYEGRYLAGLVAGQKLNEEIEAGKYSASEAKIGYVGAFSFAEVISGFTSFYLGAKEVCPSVTMDVKFTGSWYDYDLEEAAAKELIAGGCKLISGHADSYGAPMACEDTFKTEQNIYNVAYNGSTASKCPKSYLVSSKINWTPFFKYMIESTVNGTNLGTDWTGDISTGSVELAEYGSSVSEQAKTLVNNAIEKFKNKELHVFDTSKFTVDGKNLTSYLADVDFDEAYTADTEVIKDGYFHESEYRSGPYFDIKIDGINWLNAEY